MAFFKPHYQLFQYRGVGKCPKWTSPKYWGYNLQQIFESDVQNSQNGTFTKPWVSLDKTWQNETPKQRIRCPGATDGMAMAMAMTWEVGVRKKERPESKHWKTLEPNFIHSHPFSSIFRNPKSDMIYHQLFPNFFPKKWQLFLGFHDGSRWWRWFSSQPPITTPWKGRGLGSGTGGRPSELGVEVRAPESRVGKRSVSRSLFMSLNVGKTMPCLPTMTGNGWKTTYKNGDDWGIVFF